MRFHKGIEDQPLPRIFQVHLYAARRDFLGAKPEEKTQLRQAISKTGIFRPANLNMLPTFPKRSRIERLNRCRFPQSMTYVTFGAFSSIKDLSQESHMRLDWPRGYSP